MKMLCFLCGSHVGDPSDSVTMYNVEEDCMEIYCSDCVTEVVANMTPNIELRWKHYLNTYAEVAEG